MSRVLLVAAHFTQTAPADQTIPNYSTALLTLILVLSIVGCALPPPEIKSMYLGPGQPVARSDSAQVDVFLRNEPPSRAYSAVGTVEIMTERRSRSMDEMLDYARREARKLGGDALIVETESTPTAGSSVPVRNLYTGRLMYYENIAGTRRTLKGTVITWK